MKSMFYYCMLLFSILSTSSVIAVELPEGSLKIQIIQDQFILNSSNIKSAKLLTASNGNYVGLEIQLKRFAVAELERITNDGLGHSMNLVLANRIVSMPLIQDTLKDKFIIASISRAEAQAFIAILNRSKHPQPQVPVLA